MLLDVLEPNTEHRPGRRAPEQQRHSGRARFRRALSRPRHAPGGIGPITESPGPRRVRIRERISRRLLAIADAVAMTVALLSIGIWQTPESGFATLAVVPAFIVISKLAGLYDRDDLVLSKSTLDEAPSLAQASGLLALVVWLTHEVLIGENMTGGQVLWLWGAGFVATGVGRWVARRIARRLLAGERCLVIGDRPTADHVRRKIGGSRAPARVVATARLDGESDLRALTDVQAFSLLVNECDADRVIIAPVTTDAADTIELIRIAKAVGVRVSVLPRVFEVVGTAVEFDDVEGMTMLGVRHFGLSRSSWMLKRSFDVVGGSLILLACSPLLALIALAIRLESRGPVFFRQVRVGRDGHHFRIVKFRTMVRDAEARKDELRERNEVEGGLFKIADDPRITRVGRLLRATSLDELPQLLNVLAGEMSLVGPRPLVVDEDRMVEGLDRSRLHLTPGMTGHWQVLGSSRIPMHEMVGIDYLYVANWSLWQDIKILLRTVPYVLSRGGM
jgi:exopolysaccharide biosynthesis polyprenyl glycosylphosphotransferase